MSAGRVPASITRIRALLVAVGATLIAALAGCSGPDLQGTSSLAQTSSTIEPVAPQIAAVTMDGTQADEVEGGFFLTAEVNPNQDLVLGVEVTNGEGEISFLNAHATLPNESGDSSIELEVTMPSDLRSTQIPLLLNNQPMSWISFTPGEGWAPQINLSTTTALTGQIELNVEVFDLNGSVSELSVAQEFNFQHRDHAADMIALYGREPESLSEKGTISLVTFGEHEYDFQYTVNKDIGEYVSTHSLAPLLVSQTDDLTYQVRFSTEWPGRFPLQFTATDNHGNRTVQRIPVEIYWASQPWELRGVAIELQYLHAGASIAVAHDLIDLAAERHMNFVQITDTAAMARIDDSRIFSCELVPSAQRRCITLTDSELFELVEHARSLGLGVVYKPHVWAADFQGFDITPKSWSEWFDSYTSFVVEKAEVAEATGVEILSIGNELNSSHPQFEYWSALLERVRRVYSGAITYSDFTYWTGDTEGWFPLEPQLDYLGVPFYYPGIGTNQELYHELIEVHDDPTMLSMAENIASNVTTYLTPRMEAVDGSAIATELGRFNHDGTSWNPWSGNIIDTQEQIDYFEAALRSASGVVDGVFFWSYAAHPESSLGQIDIDLRATAVHDLVAIWSADGPEVVGSR